MVALALLLGLAALDVGGPRCQVCQGFAPPPDACWPREGVFLKGSSADDRPPPPGHAPASSLAGGTSRLFPSERSTWGLCTGFHQVLSNSRKESKLFQLLMLGNLQIKERDGPGAPRAVMDSAASARMQKWAHDGVFFFPVLWPSAFPAVAKAAKHRPGADRQEPVLPRNWDGDQGPQLRQERLQHQQLVHSMDLTPLRQVLRRGLCRSVVAAPG